jgi:single-strand DNA-binding protein
MAGLNKVMILGRLGKDPEVKSTQGGVSVANFSIATSESWKDKNGQKQEKTEWHRCVAFGKTADLIAKYVHKGSQLYVEGKIQTRQWDDKDGNKRYTTEVVVNQMQFIGGKASSGGGASNGGEHDDYSNSGEGPESDESAVLLSPDSDDDGVPF